MGIGFGFGIGPIRFYIPLVRFRSRRPKAAPYFTHGSCTIHHRTSGAADRCKIRPGPTAVPLSSAPHVELEAQRAAAGARRELEQTIESLSSTFWGSFEADRGADAEDVRAAAELVIRAQRASHSELMLKLGFSPDRAVAVMEALEAFRVVGPAEFGHERRVLLHHNMVGVFAHRRSESRPML